MHLFPNVTAYKIAHRRHEHLESDSLTLIDVIDNDSFLHLCSQPFDPTGTAASLYHASWVRYYWQTRHGIQLSPEVLVPLRRTLQRLELHLGELGPSFLASSRYLASKGKPSIEYKLIATSAMAARIKNAVNDYRRRKIAYERSKAMDPQVQTLLSDESPPKQENNWNFTQP